jgi:hypothetical protein
LWTQSEIYKNTTEKVLIKLVKKVKHNCKILPNKGNNKITELRTILQRESQNS